MTLPPKQCLCCGREIIKDQFCAETPDQFAKRYNGSWCRAKCKRNLPSPSPKDRPTLVADPTAWNLERPEGKEQPKEKPWRSKEYTEFVKSLPCCMTGSVSTEYLAIDPHHENPKGQGGKSTKCGDERQIPIRHDLHVKMETPGNSRADIYKQYGKDPEQLVRRTQVEWFKRFGTMPWVKS